MMRIFLHTDSGLTLETIDESITISELADTRGIGDAVGWLEDADDPLEDSTRVAPAVGENGPFTSTGGRLIEATVNYAGKTKVHSFAPGVTIGRVRRWAIGEDGFDLPQKERLKHEVGICGTGIIADRNDHIGTLATECELCLDPCAQGSVPGMSATQPEIAPDQRAFEAEDSSRLRRRLPR